MLTLGLVVLAFLLGSIPFGLLISRARGIDIRQHGSKNIGATNVGRVLGFRWGLLCFALDFAKGFVPTLLAGWQLDALGKLDAPPTVAWQWLAVLAASIAGHMFSPWLRFKGGKGVATGFGALLAVWPALGVPALIALFIWAAALASTRYMGASSCLAAATLPISVAACPTICRELGMSVPVDGLGTAGQWPMWPYLIVSVVLAALVIWKHRGNLKRMLTGTELRLGKRGRASAPGT